MNRGRSAGLFNVVGAIEFVCRGCEGGRSPVRFPTDPKYLRQFGLAASRVKHCPECGLNFRPDDRRRVRIKIPKARNGRPA